VTSVGLAWEQFRLERKLFWRNPSAAFFNFLLPLVLLLLIASVFAGDDDELNV
jgi:ABC-2 type transport system permease protein